jgi:hypothetical protein
LKADATPGVPWCDLGASNSVILGDEVKCQLLADSVYWRLRDILRLGNGIFSMSPSELVKENVCSPIRLFIKDEPHKNTKRSSGKLRLISGVAVDDQVLDRMVFGLQNVAEIQRWDSIPSKPGLGLDDTGLRILARGFAQMLERGSLQATDVSGWDWSVQSWEMEDDCRVRQKLAGVEDGDMLHFLMRVRSYCAARKVFVLPDGTLVAQTRPGIQPSGWYCTSSTNSRMRVIARMAVIGPDHPEADLIQAMGDDAVEGALDGDLLLRYEELGHTVKGAKLFTTVAGVEFCSHEFLPNGLAYPVNATKTLFRFFSHPPTSDQYLDWYAQLRNDLRNVPEVDNIFEIALAHAEWAKSNGKEEIAQLPPASGRQH